MAFMDDVRSAAIGLQRKRSMGVWTKSRLDNLYTRVPHLQRAINIQKEFIRRHAREQALSRGLDRMLMGLILFDRDLLPVYVNPVAAISVVNDLCADEIASMHNVAVSRIRTRLKAAYRKMGIDHQAELVKILLTGPFGHQV